MIQLYEKTIIYFAHPSPIRRVYIDTPPSTTWAIVAAVRARFYFSYNYFTERQSIVVSLSSNTTQNK